MSDVPSPQEELRAEVFHAVCDALHGDASGLDDGIDAAMALFAARVAAIEQERLSDEIHVDMLVAANNEQHDLAVFQSQRADRAEERVAELTAAIEAAGDELQAAWRATGEISQRVAAERKQAAAQAWQHAADFIGMNCSCSDRLLDADPYREATP